MKTLGPHNRKTAIRISKHQYRIGLYLHHQIIAAGNNVAHGLTQPIAYAVQINVGISQLQIFEEYAVQAIVIVLARMCH